MSTKFDKMIKIIKAMEEGLPIQCRLANSLDTWTITEERTPNFQEYEYRILQAMPKFRVALMFDKTRESYYTIKIDDEEDEQDLTLISDFVEWVTPWITCIVRTESTIKQRDNIVSPRY